MNRLFLATETECPFRCTYCFTRFSQYTRQLTISSVEQEPSILDGIDAVYPACDDDLFAHSNAVLVLRRAARLNRHLSVSTKARLSDVTLTQVKDVHREMLSKGKILKIAVGFTCTQEIGTIEPGTAPYHARIALLKRLNDAGIHTNIVLKPLLPGIALDEFRELFADCAEYTNAVLIGDMYLDANDFSRPRVSRRVGWLPGTPEWPTIGDVAWTEQVRIAAREFGLCVFDSDLDVLLRLLKQ
jgi:DNA repair photolyase